MAKVYEFLANGTEEIEALITVDVLRRGGVDIKTVSISGNKFIESSHGIVIKCDQTIEESDFSDADMLLLPGGLPGSTNLLKHEGVREALTKQNNAGKKIGAICAAPMVLGDLGILEGKRATCYPGCEDTMKGAEYTGELFTIDGNIITGEGPAATFPYAYAILGMFADESVVEGLKEGMRFNHLMNK
ncbi:MAG: DJ-1/PfpI family protein [Prevotella sp.]|nr:DJ-1/PfpI family protein [Prevotella sp.]